MSILSLTKQATIGGEHESSFEQSFASLAYTYIADKVPGLLDYMVGFQLVDRNNDNTKAVGIFGFKLGDKWAYAPVFFLNGELKGHELLFLKDHDLFVPLKENWTDYLLAKRRYTLGEPDSRTLQEIGIAQPDLQSIASPPYAKAGSADPSEGWQPWTKGFAPIYGALTHGYGETALMKHAGFRAGTVLEELCRRDLGFCKLAMDVCQAYPAIGEAFENFHGRDFFRKALLGLKEKTAAVVQRSALLDEPEDTGEYEFSVLGGKQAKKQAAGPAIRIVVREEYVMTPNLTPLTEEEQEKLLQDGHLVKDERTGEEKSQAYNTQLECQLSNPDETGIYEMLVKPGKFEKCLVVRNPHTHRGRENMMTVVRLSPKSWLNADASALFAKPHTGSREDWESWYEGLRNASPEKHGVYVAVSKSGDGSAPFRITNDLGEKRYRVHFRDYKDHRSPFKDHTSWGGSDEGYQYYPHEMVFMSDRQGTEFVSMDGILHLPEECKLIRVDTDDPEDDCECVPFGMPTDDDLRMDEFIPADMSDLQLQLVNNTSKLKVACDNMEFSIDNGPLQTKRAALFDLIQRHGFSEVAAKEMLKQAEKASLGGNAAAFRVKYAQPYPMMVGQPGPMAPPMQDPAMSFDPTMGNVPQQYPMEQAMPVDAISASMTDPSTYDMSPGAMPDPMAMQMAQQAGQMGQKEVFDSSMISGLVETRRQDSLMTEFSSDLIKALDRLGRLLFLFYWHNEEYADRYGESDMPELEDSLRNTFESMGDLVLYLKEKDVTPLPSAGESSPNIDDAAAT